MRVICMLISYVRDLRVIYVLCACYVHVNKFCAFYVRVMCVLCVCHVRVMCVLCSSVMCVLCVCSVCVICVLCACCAHITRT